MAAIRDNLVIGIFDQLSHAQAAVKALLDAGFPEADVGLLARHGGQVDDLAPEAEPKPAHEPATMQGVEAGALTGAGLGTAFALAVATGVFPVVGPVVAVGLFAAYLAAGAAGGAVAGSVIGGLVGLGLAEHEGTYYEEAIRDGRILVTVRSAARQAKAVELLNQHGAENIEPRIGKESTTPPHLHLGQESGLSTPPGAFTPGGSLASGSQPQERFHMPHAES